MLSPFAFGLGIRKTVSGKLPPYQSAMPPAKMHADEVNVDPPLVRRLLAAQFPHWAYLPIEPVPSAGTDNALFRLGDDMVVRLPRIHWATDQVEKEHGWLPRLAPLLPLAIPEPLALGRPGAGYPWRWAVHRWLVGQDATVAQIADPHQLAADLAQFVSAMWQVDLTGDPPPGRGRRLTERDEAARNAIDALHDTIDTAAATALWEECLRAPPWEKPLVWTHGDLIAPNLLVNHGRLTAVIDFGCLGVADPACDLVAAWSILPAETRSHFRAALDVDDATWARGRGWAFSQALAIIPYYRRTNPGLVAVAAHIIDEILADYGKIG